MDIIKIVAVLIIPTVLFLILCRLLMRLNQGRKHAGQLLLSLSMSRSQRFAAILLGTLLIAASGFIQEELVPTGNNIVVSTLRGALVGGGIGCLMATFLVTEIREEGIWMAGRLIPWSLIHSYQWTANRKPKLVINLSQRIVLQNTIKIPIEPRHQQPLEQIFQQKLTTR